MFGTSWEYFFILLLPFLKLWVPTTNTLVESNINIHFFFFRMLYTVKSFSCKFCKKRDEGKKISKKGNKGKGKVRIINTPSSTPSSPPATLAPSEDAFHPSSVLCLASFLVVKGSPDSVNTYFLLGIKQTTS